MNIELERNNKKLLIREISFSSCRYRGEILVDGLTLDTKTMDRLVHLITSDLAQKLVYGMALSHPKVTKDAHGNEVMKFGIDVLYPVDFVELKKLREENEIIKHNLKTIEKSYNRVSKQYNQLIGEKSLFKALSKAFLNWNFARKKQHCDKR